MSQPGLRKSLEKAHEALRVAINMHDTTGCIGDSCSYPYDLQKTALAAVRAALAITESDPKLIEQLSELVAEWRRRLDIHRQCGIDGNYKTCSDELELVIQGLTANDTANQTHKIKLQPKPPCTRCGGEGYIPMLNPIGAFLHIVPGMKDPCPDCSPNMELCNCDVDYYDDRVRPPCPVHVVQHKRVKRQPEDAANQTHEVRYVAEGYVPTLKPEGPVLRTVSGVVQHKRVKWQPEPGADYWREKLREAEQRNIELEFQLSRARSTPEAHASDCSWVKNGGTSSTSGLMSDNPFDPQCDYCYQYCLRPGAQPMRTALLWLKKNFGPKLDYDRAMRVVENALLSVATVEVRETKPDNIFWPPQNEAEEHLYEIRNARTKEYVQVHVDALKELYQSKALQDMIFKLPKEVKDRVRYYCAEERS
jgi:hypothetical protein